MYFLRASTKGIPFSRSASHWTRRFIRTSREIARVYFFLRVMFLKSFEGAGSPRGVAGFDRWNDFFPSGSISRPVIESGVVCGQGLSRVTSGRPKLAWRKGSARLGNGTNRKGPGLDLAGMEKTSGGLSEWGLVWGRRLSANQLSSSLNPPNPVFVKSSLAVLKCESPNIILISL